MIYKILGLLLMPFVLLYTLFYYGHDMAYKKMKEEQDKLENIIDNLEEDDI
jgi:preprotein translocase subunit YajC